MNTLTTFLSTQKGKLKMIAAAVLLIASGSAQAQDSRPVQHHQREEEYGNTLNLGVGFGYGGYFGRTTPFFSANYEINVARNFTLAPSIGIASYRSTDYYGYNGHNYYYHETVIPIAVKGAYYFDELLGANPNWDFYLAASLGFTYDHVSWDNGYEGASEGGTSGLYLDGHIGAEYHLSRKVGLFLDLSTGISTFGLAIHHL